MQQVSTGNPSAFAVESSIFNFVSTIVAHFGVFADAKAYRDEIARYEVELHRNSEVAQATRTENAALGREPAIS
jgi:hypothetical protein